MNKTDQQRQITFAKQNKNHRENKFDEQKKRICI